MGSIFRSPKAPPPPPPIVDDTLSRREKAAEDDKRRENKRFAARNRAKKGMGTVLMTDFREDGNQRGNVGQKTLGPSAGRNPRNINTNQKMG
tara:strand:+ start:235 stop:510 length:276 start_codon:yes stop_codon:yes gene_type:complete